MPFLPPNQQRQSSEGNDLELLLLYLLLLVFHHRVSLSFQAKKLPFLQILPTVAIVYFFRTDYTDSPDCLRYF